MKKYKAVLFDMDGTIYNTYRGIFNSYNYALKKMNMPAVNDELVGNVIGAPLLDVFTDIFKLDGENAIKAVDYYREYYSKNGIYQAELYDGIKDLLNYLKMNGYMIGIGTLKRDDFAKIIINENKMNDYFDYIKGIDNNDKMTKADIINFCLKKMGMDASEVLYIGDSEYDAEGAKLSDVDFIGVCYGFGFHNKNDVYRNNGIYAAETPAAIKEYLEQAI